MKQLAIIADDLTSATDCGIQVARSGLPTVVILAGHGTDQEGLLTEVISIDTDTRGKTPDEAYGIVREIASQIRAEDYANIYKSIDSTLRGNLGAEIDAVLDVFDFDLAVVAPAFPFYGRTTVNGRHLLRGVPLSHTEFASDPRRPVKEDDLLRLFSTQSTRKVGLLGLDVLRSGTRAVSERLHELNRQEIKLVVFDAQVEEDLDRVVETASKTGYRILWVGSTGLARCIPKMLSTNTRRPPRIEVPCSTRQVMLVSGSVSEVTRNQILMLKDISGMTAVEVNPLEVIDDEAAERREMKRCFSHLTNGLNSGKDVALYLCLSRDVVAATKTKADEMGLDESELARRLMAALAATVIEIVKVHKLRGLVLVGGDTSKTVCSQLGVKAIELLQEVEPGIPVGRLVGTELFVVTKAGGFGSPRSLIDAVTTLKQLGE